MLQCLESVDGLERCRKNEASRDYGLETGVGFEDRTKRVVEETAPYRNTKDWELGRVLCSRWEGERTEDPKIITTAFYPS